jgi:hypothetical protein
MAEFPLVSSFQSIVSGWVLHGNWLMPIGACGVRSAVHGSGANRWSALDDVEERGIARCGPRLGAAG